MKKFIFLLPACFSVREAVFNEGDERLDAVANASADPIATEDEWFKVAPYGDFPGPRKTQHFGRAEADKIVAQFNSTFSKLGRMFRGTPIFNGHPDADPERFRDDRRIGKVTALEAREDGLWAKPEWNSLGKENIEQGYRIYPSPYWDAPRAKEFRPDRLISVGLTNTPRISASEPVANAEEETKKDDAEGKDSEGEKKDPSEKKKEASGSIDRATLIEALRMDGDATNEEILAELQARLENPANAAEELEKMTKERDEALEKVKAAEGKTEEAANSLQVERTAHANTLIEGAITLGKVTVAEREALVNSFAADFGSAAESLSKRPALFNTEELRLERSKAKVISEAERRTKVANAVDDYMAKHSVDYDAAFDAVKADPEMKGVFEQM